MTKEKLGDDVKKLSVAQLNLNLPAHMVLFARKLLGRKTIS